LKAEDRTDVENADPREFHGEGVNSNERASSISEANAFGADMTNPSGLSTSITKRTSHSASEMAAPEAGQSKGQNSISVNSSALIAIENYTTQTDAVNVQKYIWRDGREA
jgi:hypothetical protein